MLPGLRANNEVKQKVKRVHIFLKEPAKCTIIKRTMLIRSKMMREISPTLDLRDSKHTEAHAETACRVGIVPSASCTKHFRF